MPDQPCPTRDDLANYAQGRLPLESADTVSAHLATCRTCEETLDGLSATSDGFIGRLRAACRAEPFVDEPACPNVVRSLQDAGPEGSAARAAETVRPGTGGPDSQGPPPLAAPTAPARTIDRAQFAEFVTTVGLVSASELAAVEKQLGPAAEDVSTLARALVERGKLTKFQAAAVYQGKSKSLVYGDYLVIDRIGAGGMGQVYKARHRRMDRIVALKVMSAASMKNPESVKRFEREVRAAAKVMHPNIVTALDAGAQDGVHYLVMEYVDGPDLSSLLKKQGKLSVKQACDYLSQAARGFAFAHSKGIVHRDIKPGNLLVDRDGTVKVLDMGLARFDDGAVGDELAEGELTQSGAVMGTLDYMAPEQALNTRHADAKSDVYGLGCSLYRLLSGEPVYGGTTLVEKILAHREHPVPSLRLKRADVPPPLDGLLARMLAKRPADRPSMQEIADALATIGAGGLPAAAAALPTAAPMGPPGFPPTAVPGFPPPPASAFPLAAAAPPAPAFAGARTKGAAPPRRRSNLPLLALAGAGAIGAALGIWIYIKDKDGKPVAAVHLEDGHSATIVPDGMPTGTAPPPTGTVPIGVPSASATPTGGVGAAPTAPAASGGAPPPAATIPPPTSTDPERRAVEWANPRGAKIFVSSGGKGIGLYGRPPPAEPFTVTQIDFREFLRFPELRRQISDEDLKYLVGLQSIELLRLPESQVTDAAMQYIGGLRSLTYLDLTGAQITDAGIAKLAELKDLRDLYLERTRVNDAALELMARQFPRLGETLPLGGTPITDAGLRHIVETKVRFLDVSNTNITDSGLDYLVPSKHLSRIKLDGTRVTAAGVARLKAAKPKLVVEWDPNVAPSVSTSASAAAAPVAAVDQVEIISSYPFTKKTLGEVVSGPVPDYLKETTPLVFLQDRGAPNVPAAQAVFRVRFDGPLIMCVRIVANQANLGDLRAVTFDDAALVQRGWTKLGDLRCRQMHFPAGPDEPDEQCAVYVKTCRVGETYSIRTDKYRAPVFFMGNVPSPVPTGLTANALPAAAGITGPPLDPAAERAIAELVLSKSANAHIHVFDTVKKKIPAGTALPAGPFRVVEIYLRSGVDDEVVRQIARLGSLRKLELYGDGVSDENVARFSGYPEMEDLQLGGPRLSGSGLAALAASPKLRRLSLKESRKVTDAGTTVGLSGLTNLDYISLDHNPVETLPFVRNLRKLQTIDLAHTKIRNLSGIENCTALVDFRASNTPLCDSDVAPLAGLTQMKSMTLYGTNLSDASLVHFEAMVNLTSLNLTNTYVTEAGAAKLRAKLPGCNIQFTTKTGSPPVLPPVPVVAAAPVAVVPRSTIGTPSSAPAPSGAPASGERRPVPETAAQQAALATIKDVFKDAYAAAKTPAKKAELAGKLYEQAKSAADDAERYVLLDEALKIGTEGDDLDPARRALYDLVSEFQVPKAATYLDGWKNMLAGARPPEAVRALLGDMNQLFDGAVKLAAFDDAKAIGDYAATTAQRLRDVAEIKLVRDRNTELVVRQKEYTAAQAAAEKLATTPDNPEANFAVGRYRALVEKDWGAALPLLAKGSDAVWKDLAAKTLAAGGNPPALAAVADAWWDAAQTKPAQKAELAAGARHWYQAAVNSLGGLQKTRVEKRITETEPLVVESKLPTTLLPMAGREVATGTVAPSDDKPFMPAPAFGGPKPATASSGAPAVGPTIRPAPAGAPNPTVERRAAEWVLSVGGRVEIQTQGGKRETIAAAPLPAEPFVIVTILVRNCQGVTDESMSNLAGISRLEFADLAATPVTGTGLAHLTASAATVTKFNCDSSPISDVGAAHFASFPNLTELHLRKARLTDAGLAGVAGLKNLRFLGLSEVAITDAAAVHIAGLTQLTRLVVRSSSFSDAGMAQLGRLANLENLDLAASKVTDVGMQYIPRYRKLVNLNLDDAPVTDASIPYFEQTPSLTTLVLVDTHVTTEAATKLQAKMPQCKITYRTKPGSPP